MIDMHGLGEMTICGSRDGRNSYLWRATSCLGRETERRMKGTGGVSDLAVVVCV